jgi:hypothetical protein
MEVWTKILQILDTQMETPVPYGPFHLLWLGIVVAASLALGLRGHNRSFDNVRKIVLILSVVTIVLEVYKQINYTFGDGSAAPAYQWYAFPWQFCSTPMYIGLLAGLTKKGKFHDALCAYLATFGMFAGMAVMLYPGDVFVGTVGINIQTMVCHGGMVVLGALLLASGHVKAELRTILKALPVFATVVLIAVAMNEVAYRTGLLEHHTFNMFFVSPYCEPSLPVYSLVQGVLPFPWSLLVYILGFTAAATVVLAVAMGIGKLLAHSGQKEHFYGSHSRFHLKLHV